MGQLINFIFKSISKIVNAFLYDIWTEYTYILISSTVIIKDQVLDQRINEYLLNQKL